MEERVVVLETEMKHVQSDVQELLKEVRELNESLARYRGAWGAVLMIGTALATTATLLVKFLKP